jgi:hypothetical protein
VLDLLDAATLEAPAPEIIALNRMAFGPRPGDLAALMALGAPAPNGSRRMSISRLNPAAIDDSACDALITAQGFTTLGKSRQQLWLDHVVKQNVTWDERMQPARETLHATFLRAVYSKRQLVEVLADFWHNHFNVYGWDSWSAGTWVYYDRDVVRGNLCWQLPADARRRCHQRRHALLPGQRLQHQRRPKRELRPRVVRAARAGRRELFRRRLDCGAGWQILAPRRPKTPAVIR